MPLTNGTQYSERALGAVRAALLALVTPLLEKNPVKTLAADTGVVFSMTRLIWLAFAIACLRQIGAAGVGGWPEATLAIAIVLAPPLLSALERVEPKDVLSFGQVLLGRFGLGEARRLTSVYAEEPAPRDDHHSD
jgi:hypothetical protein